MRRWTAVLVVLVLSLGFLAETAEAHGGNFKVVEAPGGVRPGDLVIGPPSAPTPSVTPPSIASPRAPPSTRTLWQPADWQSWWQLNLEAYLPERDPDGHVGAVTESSGVFQVGRAFVGHVESLGNPEAERAAAEFALPYLLGLLDRERKVPEEMIATALIAVGRIARDETPVLLLKSWAVDRRASIEVRESAVLALGLLRRSDRARQLPAETLDRIRDFLFLLFDDRKNPTRVRAFAIFSIALLSDQPCGGGSIACDGRLVTRGLWMRLRKKYASRELTIALIVALGQQPPRGVSDTVRESLRLIARGRPVFHRRWDTMERSHCLSTLGRLGGEGSLRVLLNTLSIRRQANALHTAALIGIAQQAPRLSSDERVRAAKLLHPFVVRDQHWFVRGLGHLALGALLAADLRAGSQEVMRRTRVAEFLDREARKGPTNTRPYSAVALGLTAHQVPRVSRPVAKHLERVQDAMVWGLKRGRGSDPVLGSYAVGAGLSEADVARPVLLEILGDRNRSPSLRGHCAIALGMLGRPTDEVVSGLLAGTKERISPFVHLQSVRALSLVGAKGTREELLRQLHGQRPSRPALAAVARALGRIQDPEAARELVKLADNGKASLYVRVAAVMGLGLSFDPERTPSRTRLTRHANYPALTWSLAQVFNIM